MDKMDFTQAVIMTSVLKTRLLSRETIDRMVDAKDGEQVLGILSETEYASAVEELTRSEEYEKILSSEIKKVYETMYRICDKDIVVDLLALKYDYHNLKVLIKEKNLQKGLEDIYVPISTVSTKKFQAIKDSYLADDQIQMDKMETKFKEALDKATSDFESMKDPQRIEIILDKHHIEHLYELAKKTGIPLFINYVKDLIDFTNMKVLIRLKKQEKDIKFLKEVLLPNGSISLDKIVSALNDPIGVIIDKFKCYDIRYELEEGLVAYQETGRLSEYEKQMDNYLMSLCKKSKYITFGPEPIFSYIVAKETEIKILRIIMVSKLNNISPDIIRERLRDLYV